MSNYYPLLALDLGDRFIGVAYSEVGILATKIQTIDRRKKSDSQIFKKIEEIIKEQGIQSMVVGLPISANGSENEQCQKIRKFIQNFQKWLTAYGLRLTAFFSPEDFSSKDAKYQISQKFKLNQKRPTNHSQAAKIILERFLEETKIAN